MASLRVYAFTLLESSWLLNRMASLKIWWTTDWDGDALLSGNKESERKLLVSCHCKWKTSHRRYSDVLFKDGCQTRMAAWCHGGESADTTPRNPSAGYACITTNYARYETTTSSHDIWLWTCKVIRTLCCLQSANKWTLDIQQFSGYVSGFSRTIHTLCLPPRPRKGCTEASRWFSHLRSEIW